MLLEEGQADREVGSFGQRDSAIRSADAEPLKVSLARKLQQNRYYLGASRCAPTAGERNREPRVLDRPLPRRERTPQSYQYCNPFHPAGVVQRQTAGLPERTVNPLGRRGSRPGF